MRVRNRNKEKDREWRLNNKELLREACRKSRNSTPTEVLMWRNARTNAYRRGLEFSIEPSDIRIPEVCPILKIPLVVKTSVPKNEMASKDDSPSIDRVDNSIGYTKDNIRVISHKANVMKRHLTIEDCNKLIAYMRWEI